MAKDKSATKSGLSFSDADHLLLLQLMTRRAVVERRERSAASAGGKAEVDLSDALVEEQIPELWRLVPQEIGLYDWQRKCLDLWMKERRGTIKVATGGGKTLFALAIAERLQTEHESDLRVAVIVPTIPLMFQWYDEVRQGNLPDSAIGLLGGGQPMKSLSGVRLLIAVLNSARERLPAMVRRALWPDHMLLIVDECHRANASQARKVFQAKPAYTLGLSATPEQELQDDGVTANDAYEASAVGKALGPIIYEFSIKQSLEAGLLTPFEVWHIGLPLSPSEQAEHTCLSAEISDLHKALQIRYRTSNSKQAFIAWCQTQASRQGKGQLEARRFMGLANRRKRLLYRAKARSRAVLTLLSEAASDVDSRAIVFHESIDEIDRLFHDALKLDLPVVLEHSKLPGRLRDDNINAFRRGVARSIISAKSLVEGFNVPSADLGIIAASSGSVRQRIQSLGRMLRRKSGDRMARIVVLFVRDSEDETIYEKADWETVVGAERSRYFSWNPRGDSEEWRAGLEETGVAPRTYRPPSHEIDVSLLAPGDPYPGQTSGSDLRVDSSGNLRSSGGALVSAPRELVEEILVRNPHRRARCAPAGHLIVRVDSGAGSDLDWRYLGRIELPKEMPDAKTVKFKLKTASGRRVIAHEDGRRKGRIDFALGPAHSRTPEAGQACDRLLAWVGEIEKELGVSLREIYWDGDEEYWVEVKGERIAHEGLLVPLEFGP